MTETVGNWIAISRALPNHPTVGFGQPVKPADPKRGAWSRAEAWQDLLLLAQFKPSRVRNKGAEQQLNVGELMGARSYLAKRWNWHEKTVSRWISKLCKEEMIAVRNPDMTRPETGQQNGRRHANKCNVISVCNYGLYQRGGSNTTDDHGTRDRAASGHQAGSERAQLNKETTKQNPPTPFQGGSDEILDQFEEWWRIFPTSVRKVAKGECRALFRQAITGQRKPGKRRQKILDHDPISAADLIAAAKRYASARLEQDPQYTVAPKTWLNEGRWLDLTDESEATGALPDLSEITETQWAGAIKKAVGSGKSWPGTMGPPPGNLDCWVPSALVEKHGLREVFALDGRRLSEKHKTAETQSCARHDERVNGHRHVLAVTTNATPAQGVAP